MGTIARFDLVDLHRRFGVRHFVETGTGAGGSIEHVRTTFFGPDRIRRAWSCEIDSEMSATARQRFEDDPHINVFNQKSEDFLEMICSSLREY